MIREDLCNIIDIAEDNKQDIEIHTQSCTYVIAKSCFDSIRFFQNTLVVHTNRDIYISIDAIESISAW